MRYGERLWKCIVRLCRCNDITEVYIELMKVCSDVLEVHNTVMDLA